MRSPPMHFKLAFAAFSAVAAMGAWSGLNLLSGTEREERTSVESSGVKLGTTIEIPASPAKAYALIVPGSGPTDRDGNNYLGIAGSPYKQLADRLAESGISVTRFDKRELSTREGDPVQSVNIYVDDTLALKRYVLERQRVKCLWLIGHSEGGVVAILSALREPNGICGLILVGTPGQSLGAILKQQVMNRVGSSQAQPVNQAIDKLSSGQRVDVRTLPKPFSIMLTDAVQPLLMSELAIDPASLIGKVNKPVLVIHGASDIQIDPANAKLLHQAKPDSEMIILNGMNHVLKSVGTSGSFENFKSYTDPVKPIVAELPIAIAIFISRYQH